MAQQRLGIRRTVSWATRLIGALARSAPPPTGHPALPSAPPPAPSQHLAAPPSVSPDAAWTPEPEATARATVAPETPATDGTLDAAHARGLAMARSHRWNWAQRELERAVRERPNGPAVEDLNSVRAVRRQLRILQKWPRDGAVYLHPGRVYMELGLGEDAERAFRQATKLAPKVPAGYFFLAMEYAYRREFAAAEDMYVRARALDEGLPPFHALLADWQAHLEDDDRPTVDG